MSVDVTSGACRSNFREMAEDWSSSGVSSHSIVQMWRHRLDPFFFREEVYTGCLDLRSGNRLNV